MKPSRTRFMQTSSPKLILLLLLVATPNLERFDKNSHFGATGVSADDGQNKNEDQKNHFITDQNGESTPATGTIVDSIMKQLIRSNDILDPQGKFVQQPDETENINEISDGSSPSLPSSSSIVSNAAVQVTNKQQDILHLLRDHIEEQVVSLVKQSDFVKGTERRMEFKLELPRDLARALQESVRVKVKATATISGSGSEKDEEYSTKDQSCGKEQYTISPKKKEPAVGSESKISTSKNSNSLEMSQNDGASSGNVLLPSSVSDVPVIPIVNSRSIEYSLLSGQIQTTGVKKQNIQQTAAQEEFGAAYRVTALLNKKRGEGEIHHEKILSTLGMTSYPKTCNETIRNYVRSSLRDDIPLPLLGYNCSKVLEELEYHRTSGGYWTERSVLEDTFFSLTGMIPAPAQWLFPEYKLAGKKYWKSHPLVVYDGWMSDDPTVSHCNWVGVTCGFTTLGQGRGQVMDDHDNAKNRCDGERLIDGWTGRPCPPPDSITKIDLVQLGVRLVGKLPENLYMLRNLHRLNLMGNRINGGIPESFGMFEKLEFLDLSQNELRGPFPKHLPSTLTELWLERNVFHGELHLENLTSLNYLDVSNNRIEGSIPSDVGKMTSLRSLVMGGNNLTYTIPEFGSMAKLRVIDLTNNELTGTIPDFSTCCPHLTDLYLGHNHFEGQIHGFQGQHYIHRVSLNFNKLTSIHDDFYHYAGSSLKELDLSYNLITGTLPSTVSYMENLRYLNLTENKFSGSVPKYLCQHKGLQNTEKYGCDAVMCERGTFHPSGSATGIGPCAICPDNEMFLGQTTCPSKDFLIGDMDGNGVLSEREVLRLFYIYTNGPEWGAEFQPWVDMSTESCSLKGISCNSDHRVTGIVLVDANFCVGAKKHPSLCLGIPSEISLLRKLQILQLKSNSLISTLPTEIGKLKNLIHLDLSDCTSLRGSIPSEIGKMKSLSRLDLSTSGLASTIPESIGLLSNIAYINLSMTKLSGTIPGSIGNLSALTDLILSRCRLHGTIPETIFSLKKLENLELYGNALTGTLSSSIANLTSLKRIDLFSNNLSSTIPSSMATISSLQIIHLQENKFSGTLPWELSKLPVLSWLDVSENKITGPIPPLYGSMHSLKDLRLGSNKIYGPIPDNLCNNKSLNKGLTSTAGCDAILCPLGTFSEAGFATTDTACKPCPEGTSSIHLGSKTCQVVTRKNLLEMLYDVIGGDDWPEDRRRGWNSDLAECDWEGVTCGENGDLIGLSFPISGSKI